MKKKIFVIILFGLFLLGATGCGNETNKYTGIYHDDDNDNTLRLNDDYSCILEYNYPNEIECTWTQKDNFIEVTYNKYYAYSNGKKMENYYYYTLDKCETALARYETVNCNHEPEKATEEATVVEKGLLMNNNLFEKIG